jgi:diguanylate cyclase (GGDEF)-like protein
MDGAVLLVVVGVLTIVVGAGLGYGFAAVKFLSELHALNRDKAELQRQLAATPARNQSVAASTPTASQQQVVSTQQPPPETPIAPASNVTTNPVVAPADQSVAAIAEPQAAKQPAEPESPAVTASWQRLITETAARAQSDVLCIVDIDYLRQYRERYGQELGDYVAGHVEQTIRHSLQDLGAVISRYEGQEFILAWPAELGSAAKRLWAARQTTAKLRAEVEQAFLQLGAERLTVTISFGLALCEPGLTGEQVIARADEALAAAKKAGRNRGYYHSGEKCLPVEPLEPLVETKSTADDKVNKRARNTSGLRERRRHERKPCSNINLLAPCSDGILPSMDKFQRVQFFDISSSGFSMLVHTVPTTSQFAVALINDRGLIFMAAEVANVRQAKRVAANDKPLLIVGCRFSQRMYPQEARILSEVAC